MTDIVQMDCNKDNAIRAKENAEKKLMVMDIAGAKKFALKAQNLYPGLDGLPQLLATLDVYISAEVKINGVVDSYKVLGVEPSADDDTIRRQYRKLILSVHPDKNKSVGANGAFKIVSEAWGLLSDKAKKFAYDQNRNLMGQYANVLNGMSVPNGQNDFHNFANNNNANARDEKSFAHPKPVAPSCHSSNSSTDLTSATHPKPVPPPYHLLNDFHNFVNNINANARDQKSAAHPIPAPSPYHSSDLSTDRKSVAHPIPAPSPYYSSNLSTDQISATHPKPVLPPYHLLNDFHNFVNNINANARDQKSAAHPIPAPSPYHSSDLSTDQKSAAHPIPTPSPYHSSNLSTDQISATHPKSAPPLYYPLNGFPNFTSNNNANASDQKSATHPMPTSAAHPIPTTSPYHSSNLSTYEMSATHPKPAPPPYFPSLPLTFWTTCNACKTQFEHLRVYVKHILLCLNCRQSFFAVETPPPPMNGNGSSTLWSNYMQQNSSMHTMVRNSNASGRNMASTTYSGVDLSNRTFWSAPASATQVAGVVQSAYQKLKRRLEPTASGSSNGGSSSVLTGGRPKKRSHIDEQRMNNEEREMENQMPREIGGIDWYKYELAQLKKRISLYYKD